MEEAVIELKSISRRFFKFRCDGKLNFDFCNVKACNGEIQFQRKAIYEKHRTEFSTVDDCILWYKQFERAMMDSSITVNGKIPKRLYDVKTVSIKISENEWQLVSQYMINPDRFDFEKDIKIFECYLANNFMDRDGERFSIDVLRSFEKSIIGKSLLISHRWAEPGIGRFYFARIVPMSVEETLEFINSVPDQKFKRHLEHVSKLDGGIFWLVPRYYMLNITDEQRQAVLNVESGIWKDMSIGFRAPLKVAIYSDGTEKIVWDVNTQQNHIEYNPQNPIMFLEYRNTSDLNSEALEGSFAFLGAQYGASTTNELENKIDSIRKLVSDLRYKLVNNQGLTNEFKQEDSEIKYYLELINKKLAENQAKAEWSTAYINSLEDNCFAFCEDTGKKDDEGNTIPKNARHLPHHAKGNGASGTGGTVDLPHLRNALVRLNQIVPVTDTISTSELRAKAKAHLIAHAKKLGIGNYDEENEDKTSQDAKQQNLTSCQTKEKKIMKEFDMEILGEKYTVRKDQFDDDLKIIQEAINAKIIELTGKINELEKSLAQAEEKLAKVADDFEQIQKSYADLDAFRKSAESIFGEEVTTEDLKRAKDMIDKFRDAEIKRALKFGGLIGIITDEKKELELYQVLDTEKISAFADKYYQEFIAKHPEFCGLLEMNHEEKPTLPKKPSNHQELRAPVDHFRL